MTKLLHITVATSPGRDLTLQHDLRLLKAAILYGDQVKLCSLTSSLLVLILQLSNVTGAQKVQLMKELVSALPSIDQSRAIEALAALDQLRRKRVRNREELRRLKGLEKIVADTWSALEAKVEEIAQQMGATALLSALESGLVELEVYHQADTDGMVKAFFESVGGAVASGESYPLLDDQTGELVRAAVREGQLTPGEAGLERGQIVGLASDLFQRLPLFDLVPLEETLLVREALSGPLIRFRSAMIGYAKAIESAQWDETFRHEAEIMFRQHVEPAVLAIEEELRSNSLVGEILRKFLRSPILPSSSSALGLFVSKLESFSPILGAGFGLALGATVLTYDAFEEWRARNQDVERNQLYFYYRAAKEFPARASLVVTT